MEVVEDKLFLLSVTKNNKLKGGYVRSQIGKSPDGFVTFSFEMSDGTIHTLKFGEIIKLGQKAGVIC